MTAETQIIIAAETARQAKEILQRLADAKFPARLAFSIGRLRAELNASSDLAGVEAARRAAIRNYGEDDGKGSIRVTQQNWPAFFAEYAAEAERRIALTILPLPLAILDHAPDVTPAEMAALIPFLETCCEPVPQEAMV